MVQDGIGEVCRIVRDVVEFLTLSRQIDNLRGFVDISEERVSFLKDVKDCGLIGRNHRCLPASCVTFHLGC